ncbi:hypothetical protein [Magnetospirillum molischianum]|uniref:Uncharacterized protein n=1 Tax=Magnetospirillum molischianum DSM 120 TaxID=1150626 RepID=H8FP31_MAGML|nr:hypothetical protein [Magnetospirillum molischianum]CCG40119.1 conserved hypothetical protein [Magnetospirillum molischianum DSM 120]
MVMGIWSRAFPTKEVRASLLALSIEKERISKDIFLSSAFSIVEKRVISTISELPDNVKKSITEDGFSPTDLVRIMLRNGSHDILSSGALHIYRGVLSVDGNNVHSLWTYLVNEFVKEGKMTPEEAESDRDYLAEQIASAG